MRYLPSPAWIFSLNSRFFALIVQLQCFLLIHSTVDRNTCPEGFKRINIGEHDALISFLVDLVGV